MKMFAILFAFLSLNTAMAADPFVQVIINGQTYNCSGGDSSETACLKVVDAANAKFKACVAAGYSGGSCYNLAFSGKKVNDCTMWSDACNDACKQAGYSAGSCYNSCFQ